MKTINLLLLKPFSVFCFLIISNFIFAQENNSTQQNIFLQQVTTFVQVFDDAIVCRTDLQLNNPDNTTEIPDSVFSFILSDTTEVICNGARAEKNIFLTSGINNIQIFEKYSGDSNHFFYNCAKWKNWRGKIDEGKIFVQLMNGKQIDCIQNLLPADVFVSDGSTIIMRAFKNMEPDTLSNVHFDFCNGVSKTVLSTAAQFDSLQHANANLLAMKTKYRNDNAYEVTPERSIKMVFLFIAGTAMAIIILTIIGFQLYKLWNRLRGRDED